jgi:hypothetical protein
MKRIITGLAACSLVAVGCGKVDSSSSEETGRVAEADTQAVLYKCRATCDDAKGKDHKDKYVTCATSRKGAEGVAAAACAEDGWTLDSVKCSHVRDGGQPVECFLPGGGGNGDPHMYTFDGLRYELQPLGEFILATDNQSYTIQVRTEQYGATQASLQTAVSVNLGGDTTVALYARQNPALTINGQPASIPCPNQEIPNGQLCTGRVDFDNGGWVAYDASQGKYSVYLQDETSHLDVWMRGDAGGYMNTDFRVGPAIRQATVGLLGNINGDRSDDLMTRDGKVMQQPVQFSDFYANFAGSWRTSDAETLFTYAPGYSAANFTDQAFPRAAVQSADFPVADHDAALANCRAAGVQQDALEQCVIDAVLIGGAAVQDFLHVGNF